MTVSRRQFLAGAAGSLGALALARRRAFAGDDGSGDGGDGGGHGSHLPNPRHSGIEHIVVVTMENRSFDHFLGWLPGADGRQAGLSYVDRAGVAHPTYPLAPDYQGCGHPDPAHDYDVARVEYDNGACDGWLRAGQNDLFSIGYYTRPDLPFLGAAASAFTTCDRYFAAILAGTYPNRMYQHAAVTDRLYDTTEISTLPTIWDRLAAAGLDGRYYFGDVPFLGLWGAKYAGISRPYASFLADCASGALPQVAFVDPRFALENEGLSGDDHPHADIRAGETFLDAIYRAVTSSPAWASTVLVITYDEWGGFFDHVAPGVAPDVRPEYRQRGFRVPTLLVSPYARRGFVSHGVFDHTSVLKMIEWRYGLAPLSVRDAAANNLATALDFSRRNLAAPSFLVPPVLTGAPCPAVPTLP